MSKKVHYFMLFNNGNTPCGLIQINYKTTWNVQECDCLKCLKHLCNGFFIGGPVFQDKAIKRYNQIRKLNPYKKAFDDLLK